MPAASAQTVALDPTFGDAGIALGTIPNGGAYDLLNDGQKGPVIVGQVSDAAGGTNALIARYDPDGNLDPLFNGDGFATLDLGGVEDAFFGVAVYDEGPYAVAGFTNAGAVVVRYLDDGRLDSTFGAGGVVRFVVGTPRRGPAIAYDIALAPDGGLYVCGTGFGADGGREGFLLRLTRAGALDPTFGAGGFAPIGDLATDLAGLDVAPDGRVVVAGLRLVEGLETTNGVVVRVLPSGAVDSTFAGGAFELRGAAGTNYQLYRLALRSDGGLYAVGLFSSGTVRRALVVSLTNGGGLEPSYAGGGLAFVQLGAGPDETAFGAAVDEGGRLLVAGRSGGTWGLARLQRSGEPDPLFGPGGMVQPTPGQLNAVAFDDSGNLLVAGAAVTPDGDRVTAVARYTASPVSVATAPDAVLALAVVPNPAAGVAGVALTLAAPADAAVRVVDALGRTVARLADRALPAGTTVLDVDAARLAPGVYAVVAETGDARTVARFTVAR